VTEYVNQIYVYLRQLELEQNVEKDYLGNKKGTQPQSVAQLQVCSVWGRGKVPALCSLRQFLNDLED
jgi:hypothetical protein